jgi:tetratricopeptide (TPR) repeat protein
MVEDASSFWTDIQRYEDMLVADPRSLCFAPLSELYRKLGLLDDAISVAKKGCDLHADYHAGFFALGAACYQKGLNNEARQALERAVELKPDHSRAQKLLGQLYVEVGELSMAEKVLEQVLRRTSNDIESQLLLRSILSSTAGGDSEEEMLEEAEIIEELTDVVDEPMLAEADLLDLSEISELLEELPELAEDDLEEDQLEEDHLEDSEEFWALEPIEEPVAPKNTARDPLLTPTLAELYVLQGFIDKALTVYQKLLVADSTNQSYRQRAAELSELSERQKDTSPAAAPTSFSEQPAAQQKVVAAQDDVEIGLSSWLENIRRRKDGV